MKPNQALSQIVYLSVPTDLQKSIDSFSIDPAILLPVELIPGTESFDISSLSWEMIVSAMLKILAWTPEHKDSDYFRNFIKAMRPNIITELTQAAVAKAEAHDYALAEEIFRATLGLQPDNCRYVLNLALVLDQRSANYKTLEKEQLGSDYEEEAALWYSRALSLDEVLPEAYLYAGHFFLKINNTARALDLLKSFAKLGTDHPELPRVQKIIRELETNNLSDNLFKEAFDFIRMNKDQEGLERINLFIERNPDVWNAHFIKGWALRRLGRFSEGVDCFRTTIKLGGTNADTLNELAICLMELGSFAESQKALEEALRIDSENTKIISNMGILCLKSGKPEEAKRFFETVLVFDPLDPIATKYLEHIDLD